MAELTTRDQEAHAERLLQEAVRPGVSRRRVIERGLALGLSVPVLQAMLRTGGRRIAAQTPVAGPIPILGRELTADELKAEIESEGEVVVGNWTYTANDALVQRFQDYVNTTYGVGISLTYEGTQSPSTYLANLYAAIGSDNESPYDVLAIEENYWAEALAQGESTGTQVMEEFLPSPLIPNADLVSDQFKHFPTTIGFQASASPSIVYNRAEVEVLTDWKDLNNPALQGKLTLPLPGDITCGGFLIGLAGSLGLDYTNVDQMKQAADYAVDEIGPNVLRYTTDSAEMQQLLRSGSATACGFWNSLARLEFLSGAEGTENTVALVASSGQYLANGFMWIPAKAKHPVLAQIFVDWRLSPDAQFPNDWGIENGPWAELQEGLLGPSYEQYIPDWFKDQYFTYYPTIDQLNQNFKSVDWAAYAAGVGEWMDYYTERLGL